VTQVVAPKGVPSLQSVTCATNLAAINTNYAVDLAYDAPGTKLVSATSRFTDPDSGAKTAVIKYEYADAANPGSVTRVIPPRGNTAGTPDYSYATTITYYSSGSRSGQVASVADALGDTMTYDYDSVGRAISVVDPLGNAVGGVPADHTTNVTYDKEDRTRFVRLPAPIPGGSQISTETQYDAVGNPIVRIDGNGQVATYAHDARDALFQVKESPNAWTNPANPPSGVITTEYAYDAAGMLTRITRAKGDSNNERATDYTFDGRGLIRTERQYPTWPSTSGALVATSTYDPDGNHATLVDPLGRVTSYAYDALNRVTGIDYSNVGTPDVTLAYDANANRTSMTDGTGSTSYTYDEANRPTLVGSPGPKTVGYRYDLDGNRTKLIYPDATAVVYAFNKAGQLASLQDWASRTVSYTYRPDGLVKTATNADASVASYGYDNTARLTDILQTTGATAITQHSYVLDPLGNVMGLSEYVQGITQGAATWSLSAKVNDDSTTTSQVAPDVATGPNAASIAAWQDYRASPPNDPFSQIDIYASRWDPATQAWGSNVRVNDVATGQQYKPSVAIDATNNAYAAWVDWRNGRADIYFSKRSASTGLWSANVRINSATSFNSQDQPTIAVAPNGDAIALWYRSANNKLNIWSARLSAGSTIWGPEIRVTSNQTTQKQGAKVAVGSTGTSYAVWMDPAVGNADIWYATLPSGSSTWTTNTKISDDPGTAFQGPADIGVDGAGNVLVSWTDRRTTPYQLRVRRLPAGGSWTPSVIVATDGGNSPSIAVRADGRAYIAWHDGDFSTLYPKAWGSSYDPAAGSWSTPERIDSNGSDHGAAAPAAAIDATRIMVVWKNALNVPSGNNDDDIVSRFRSTAGGSGQDTFAYGYDRLYRLTSVSGPDGSRTYGYDPVGNRTSKILGTTTPSTYDRADRITAVGSTSVTVNANGNTVAKGADTFAYDQANRLTSATVSGSAETYSYDGDGIRFSRQVGTGPVTRYVSDLNRGLAVTIDDGTRKYVYGLGLAYAATGSAVEVYHTDGQGSVRAITDVSGSLIASYRTDEWGISTASSGISAQPLGFAGEPRDATGLSYLRARYLDPTLGRFLTRDTLGGHGSAPTSLNRYAYALANPVTLTDPSGRSASSKANGGGVDQYGCSTADPCFPALQCFYGVCWLTPFVAPVSSYHCDAECQLASLKATGLLVLVVLVSYAPELVPPIVRAILESPFTKLIPVVLGAQPKITELALKFKMTVDELISTVMTNGARYLDTANSGNINIFLQRPDGPGFIRLTLDPTGQRIISAGLNQAKDVINGIENGRFIPIP
jgi:RHS repeat-associated protein